MEGLGRSLSQRPTQARAEERLGTRTGKAGLLQKDDFSHRGRGGRFGVLALSGHG
jgi:hypothetical protein